MAKKKVSAKKTFRKQARQAIYDQLVVSLAGFKRGIKDKKFESNLRKTSKLFATDIAKADKKSKGKLADNVNLKLKVKTDKKEDLQAVS